MVDIHSDSAQSRELSGATELASPPDLSRQRELENLHTSGSAYDPVHLPSAHLSSSRQPQGTLECSEYDRDIEQNKHLKPMNDSYAGLGTVMDRNPDVAIVRRFGPLNAQNLLYLQAELVILERKLREREYYDRYKGNSKEKHFHNDYNILRKHPKSEQYQLVLEIRAKLKEYNDALKDQKFLSSLQEPSRYDLRWLRDWLKGKHYGNRFITSDDSDVYEPLSKRRARKSSSDPSQPAWATSEDDLVGLGPGGPSDPFSKMVINGVLVFWHRIFGRHRSGGGAEGAGADNQGIVAVSQDPALQLVSVASTIVASMLPVAAVFALQALPAERAYVRLGAFAAFTLVFALAMSLCTGAKRSDIFGASAAFAAVQVVFIGTNSNNNN